MGNNMIRRALSLSASITLLLIGLSTAALAHVGDHSHMTFAGLADHLMSGPDHQLAIMAVLLVMAIAAGAGVLASRKHRRQPETPRT